jgi:hypothetical protein
VNLLWDSVVVFKENWQLVLIILLLILLGQFQIYAVLKLIFGQQLAGEEYLSLALAGWLLPASLLSLLWHGLRMSGLSQSSSLLLEILPVLLLLLYSFRVGNQFVSNSKIPGLGLLVLFGSFILIRLAFVSKLLMPPYFDSVRHYTIIQSLLEMIEAGGTRLSVPWLGADYYHLGFHFLAAFVASSGEGEITKTMLVLGQMILAATPLSLFFLIEHETRSNRAGLFAVILAGIGWSMPAYAVNWGKYPAVTSLALLPFVLSLAYLAVVSSKILTTQKKWALYTLLLSGILVAGLFHSRSLIVIGIAFLAWTIACGWQSLSKPLQAAVLGMLALGILFEVLFIQRQEVLELLFEPYGRKGFLVTGIVIGLSIFALKTGPRLAFANLLGIFFLLGCLFVPTLGVIPRLANLTLLDRTFVEMVLYLPLSLLGGLGLAGLEQTFSYAPVRPGKLPALRSGYIGLLLFALIAGNALWRSDFYPSDCCTIVGQDDLTAMDWIRNQLPSNARILISADELIVQASGVLQGYAAADAGGWITPLTNRVTVPLRYDTNLGKEKKFRSLCKLGVDYIYIGAVGRSFYAPRLRAHPDWYRPLFTRSRTEVYQVIGCP